MADQAPQISGPSRSSFKLVIWTVVFTMLLFIFTGIVILGVIGMIPTMVAYWIDRVPGKYSTFCVGGTNLAGVIWPLTQLWDTGGGWGDALEIAGDPLNLMVMYGAAALGWMIYLLVPPVILATLAVTAQHRIQQLRSDQRALIQEWGPDIAATSEPEPAEN